MHEIEHTYHRSVGNFLAHLMVPVAPFFNARLGRNNGQLFQAA